MYQIDLKFIKSARSTINKSQGKQDVPRRMAIKACGEFMAFELAIVFVENHFVMAFFERRLGRF